MEETPLERIKRQDAESRKRKCERQKGMLRAYSRNSKQRRKREEPVGYWFSELRRRAERKNYEFDLTKEFLIELFKPMVCSVTGIKLDYTWSGSTKRCPWQPSIDRIDSSRGYTMDNVRLVCHMYNLAKSEWYDETVLEMVQALKNKFEL